MLYLISSTIVYFFINFTEFELIIMKKVVYVIHNIGYYNIIIYIIFIFKYCSMVTIIRISIVNKKMCVCIFSMFLIATYNTYENS